MVWYAPGWNRESYHIQFREFREPVVSPLVLGGIDAGSNVGGASSDSGDDTGPRSQEVSRSNIVQEDRTRDRLRWLGTYLVLRRGLRAEELSLAEANDPEAHFQAFAREIVRLLWRRQ